MTKDYKARLQKSINEYSLKNARYKEPKDKNKSSGGGRRSKNKSPESDWCRDYLDPWLKDNNFKMDRVEAKATYNKAAGRYMNSPTVSGMSDRVGNDQYGRACFIEAKAPKRAMQLRMDQYDFLLSKIESNCFAVCVNDIDRLSDIYNQWCEYTINQLDMAAGRRYLKELLQAINIKDKKKYGLDDTSPLFD